jgi:hypothetical protein
MCSAAKTGLTMVAVVDDLEWDEDGMNKRELLLVASVISLI